MSNAAREQLEELVFEAERIEHISGWSGWITETGGRYNMIFAPNRIAAENYVTCHDIRDTRIISIEDAYGMLAF